MQIKNWRTGEVIFEADVDSIKELVELAVRKKVSLFRADLGGADLRGADLGGADLGGAYLVNADLTGAYLRGAELRGADLRGANLVNAYLEGADLEGACLTGADLEGADLYGADLVGADLRGADLEGADLEGAYLRNCIGNGKEIKSIKTKRYIIVFSKFDDLIRIGCEKHSFEEWKNFTDGEINKMDEGALEWWRENKERVFRKFGEFKGE